MDLPRLIVFDMDGVLADVSRSYRVAVLTTAEAYLRDILGMQMPTGYFTHAHTEALKRAGGFNNDWDVAAGLVLAVVSRLPLTTPRPVPPGAGMKDAVASVASLLAACTASPLPQDEFAELCQAIAANGGGLTGMAAATGGRNAALVLHTGALHDTDVITRLFQEQYLGGAAFRRVYGLAPLFYQGAGLAEQESLLVPAALLHALAREHKLGIATGRPRYEAGFFLERHGIAPAFAVVITEDDIAEAEADEERATGARPSLRKPGPWSVLTALARLGDGVGAYLGDTLDDLRAARAAAAFRPVWAVGCLWGAHERAAMRQAMQQLQPDLLLETPAGLAAWLHIPVTE